jgi:hypothetical protein
LPRFSLFIIFELFPRFPLLPRFSLFIIFELFPRFPLLPRFSLFIIFELFPRFPLLPLPVAFGGEPATVGAAVDCEGGLLSEAVVERTV